MMTHYLDLRCLTPPNETGWMLGRVMRQVHGYLASGNISDLAIALPRMKSHHPGDCLRMFAAMDRLEDLLDKTGLRYLQESGVIDLADVSEVPKHTELAVYTRARQPEKGSSSQIARRELRFLEHLCTRQKSELTKTVLQNLESKPSLQVVMNSISSLTLQFKLYLKWNKSHLDVLSILIVAIIKRRTVNWTELATTFPGTAQTSSCYRRIQRFFKGVAFDEETFAQLIARLFSPEGAWMLSMDRTNWMFGAFKINILYLAINYKNMAIPILWTLLGV